MRIWLRDASANDPLQPEIPNFSFRNLWIYRIVGFLSVPVYLLGAHNFYAGYYKRGIIQFIISNGSLILGMLHNIYSDIFPNIQPWPSFILLAVYAWVLIELFNVKTDSNGDLLSREVSRLNPNFF